VQPGYDIQTVALGLEVTLLAPIFGQLGAKDSPAFTQLHLETPVLLRHEGFDLLLSLADEP